MVVLLYKSGIPVKLTEQFTELRFDIEGFLSEFTFQETTVTTPIRYNFYSKSKFKTNDRKRTDLIDGFYDETQYLKYIENTGPNIPLGKDMIYTYKFNFDKYTAKSGDAISVNVTNFDTPYNLFFDRKKYDFIIENTIDGKGVRSYAEGILDGFEVIDYKLRLPSIFTPSTLAVPSQVNTPGYHFYAKNLGDYINNFSNNDDKRKLKKIAILIIFQIRYIIRDIFPDLLNNSTSEAILEAEANSNNTDLSGLSNLEQMLFLLKKSWGYYYDPNSTLPHRNTLATIFDEQSSYSDFEYYYIGLVSFYNETYVKQKALSTASDSQKYDYLLSILPVNALSALPLEIIKKKILSLLDSKRNKEYREQYIARLVLAIAPIQANDFLDFLLEQENGVNTNFERLFNYLDDARIERIPILNWFTDEKTNRMAFVYAVHELWKVSKYSLQDATGEVNEQSYFFTDGVTYYKNQNGLLKPVVLESGRLSSVSSGNAAIPLQTNTWVNYEADKTLKHELVTINKKINITNYYLSSSGNYLGPAPSLDTSDSIPSQYHLYQSISLIGHQADDRTILPNNQPIPAFLFYYTEDFERILKIDAQIALAVNLGIEVVLFFTVGGITQLRHLQHLKHFTKIRSALEGTLPASTEVLVWAGLEAGAQTTAISASTMYVLGQYNGIILPTLAQRNAQAEANKVFLYIALVAAGGSVYCRYKAVTAAKQALIDGAGVVAMPEDVKAVLQTLVGESANAVVSFETKLSTLPQLENANVIATRYASYTDDLKNAFYRDFGSIKNTETDFWNALNKTSTLDNWEELRLLAVLERNEISIITNTARTNAYIKNYSEIPLREVLERASYKNRINFMDKFGNLESDVFLNLIEAPNGITLLNEASFPISTTVDYLKVDDILNNVLKKSPTRNEIGTLIERQRLNWDTSVKMYRQNITFEEMSVTELRDFHNNFNSYFSGSKLNDFKQSNRINTRIGCYNDSELVEPVITEWYISGSQEHFDEIFEGTPLVLRERFIQPSNIERYEAFVTKAFDKAGRSRMNDTETKFLFNFFENHFHKGNRFVIEIESGLYTCTSCQKYLQAAKAFAKSEGKVLEIKFIAHPGAIESKKVKDLLK